MPWTIVLTKADLLDSVSLVKSVTAVQIDLERYVVMTQRHKSYSTDDNMAHTSDNSNIANSSLETISVKKRIDTKGNLAVKNNDITPLGEYDDKCDSNANDNINTNRDEDYGREFDLDNTDNVNNIDQDVHNEIVMEKASKEAREAVPIIVVSANTGAGVQNLWNQLFLLARKDTDVEYSSDTVVREHKLATLLRSRQLLKSNRSASLHSLTGPIFTPKCRKLPLARSIHACKFSAAGSIKINRRSIKKRENEAAQE